MPVTPNTVVHFLNVPLENNYKNQIYFGNRSDQTTFMLTKRVNDLNGLPLTFSNLTYQRKDNVIRVPRHIDQMLNANYVMYQNTTYTDRWFYAFITKMEYVNDGRTDVYIETDVWQTWFDKITLKDSFVEREHVTNDTIGLHTVPEGLETGEYICNGHEMDEKLNDINSDITYVMGTTSKPTDSEAKDSPAGSGKYNGIYSGVKYYYFETQEDLDTALANIAKAGKSDCVTGIFMAPKFLCPYDTDYDSEASFGSNRLIYPIENSNAPQTHTKTINPQNRYLHGYEPKNKKLLTFPYNYLLVSNNNGSSVVYQYEFFSDSDEGVIEFDVKSALCPGCSIRMIPKKYKGIEENDEEGINLGKYPICNWTSDMYTNWLTQNSVNMAIDYAKGGIQILGGATMLATGGPMGLVGSSGLIYSGAVGIAETMAQKHQYSLVPPQANGNLNCGDVITSDSKNTFHFYKMTIKKEYAEMIDNYFEMFGYKVNTVKTPKLNTRPHWNYIKTIGINLDGKAPQEDLKKIRQMFDNGVTFWKNGNEVEDYSLNNH